MLRKIGIIVFSILVAAFVAIQFFRPAKNKSQNTENHILKHENLSASLQNALQNSCFDCHSDNTKYLWYHNIAPVSWMINKHIVDGKKELNFSEWGKMDDFDKISELEDIKNEVERGTMPMKAYVLMHPKSKLSEENRTELIGWLNKKADELINTP